MDKAFSNAMLDYERMLQENEVKKNIEIAFDENDHRDMVLFEMSAGINSLKEHFEGIKDKASLNLVGEMEKLLSQLEQSSLVA